MFAQPCMDSSERCHHLAELLFLLFILPVETVIQIRELASRVDREPPDLLRLAAAIVGKPCHRIRHSALSLNALRYALDDRCKRRLNRVIHPAHEPAEQRQADRAQDWPRPPLFEKREASL